MKNFYTLSILIAGVFGALHLQAQDTTFNLKPKAGFVEEMVGNNRQFLQLMINNVFTEKKKTGLLSISAYAADYKYKPNNNEFQNTTLIYHRLFKGISINSGTGFTSVEGLKSFVGLQYMYQSTVLLLVYMPCYYFTNSKRISNFALIEYKPVINKNWSFYSRLQLHYNYDLENETHFRSYAYGRLGLTYKYFSFGLAYNFDSYGSDKNTKTNYGVFLKLPL